MALRKYCSLISALLHFRRISIFVCEWATLFCRVFSSGFPSMAFLLLCFSPWAGKSKRHKYTMHFLFFARFALPLHAGCALHPVSYRCILNHSPCTPYPPNLLAKLSIASFMWIRCTSLGRLCHNFRIAASTFALDYHVRIFYISISTFLSSLEKSEKGGGAGADSSCLIVRQILWFIEFGFACRAQKFFRFSSHEIKPQCFDWDKLRLNFCKSLQKKSYGIYERLFHIFL